MFAYAPGNAEPYTVPPQIPECFKHLPVYPFFRPASVYFSNPSTETAGVMFPSSPIRFATSSLISVASKNSVESANIKTAMGGGIACGMASRATQVAPAGQAHYQEQRLLKHPDNEPRCRPSCLFRSPPAAPVAQPLRAGARADESMEGLYPLVKRSGR